MVKAARLLQISLFLPTGAFKRDEAPLPKSLPLPFIKGKGDRIY